ncbi:MAG TPA: type II toxin-antitoxin system prevent-host-death family antitoxin [Caulobacteraceae bacterium]
MLQVPASEFARNFGRYREAAQREPVAVTNHDRVTGVLVSPQDFDEYQRLKRLATRALFVEDLSNDAVAAIEAARMDDRHAELDRLMDD